MISVIAFLGLYAFLVFSGMSLAFRLKLSGALGISLMTFTFGAAQLLLSIQLLSLFYQLTGVSLFLLNACLTLTVVAATRSRNCLPTGARIRLPRRIEVRSLLKLPRNSLLSGMALVIIAWFVALGFLMFPMTDTYHFAMPLFWKQHATVFPYPTANPRLTGLVFASEALCFPGQLYLRTNAVFLILAGVSMVLTIWTVISISKKIGVSSRAATFAGISFVGYSSAINGITGGSPDPIVAAMWFAACLYFLLESKTPQSVDLTNLGCSVFCLLMTCGAKNVAVLQFPAYALGAVLLLGRDLVKVRVVRTIALWGAAGVICSTVLWSYTSNLLWFGTSRGHVVLSETVATDMRPTAIWTRISRSTVSSLMDPNWVPNAYSQQYKDFIRTIVRYSGAQDTLPEENDPYYSFSDENLRPGRGLGFLGLLVLVPSLVFGAVTCFRSMGTGTQFHSSRRAIAALLVITIVSFITFYATLRWQQVGLTRLMLTCLVAGVPLCGLLLEHWRWRVFTLVLVFLSVAAFSVYSIGMVSRRIDISPESKLSKLLSRIQRDRSSLVTYQWAGETPAMMTMREAYTLREVYQLFLSRISEPATVGVVGGTNTDEFFLFGKNLSNRVVPLIDCRSPHRLLQPSEDVDYIVLQDSYVDETVESNFPGFDPWLRVQLEGKKLLTVLRRSAEKGGSHPISASRTSIKTRS